MRAEGQRQQLQVIRAGRRLLAAALLLVACTGGGEEPDSAASAGMAAQPSAPGAGGTGAPAEPGPPTSHDAAMDTLEFRIDAPATVHPGTAVRFRLVARNSTTRPLELYLRGREIAFDITVETPDGALVWNRLYDEIVPAILRVEILAPGDSIVLSGEWPQRSNSGASLPAGRYIVRGSLLTEGAALATPPRELRIAPADGG